MVSKLLRRIDKEGNEVVPLLTDLWRKTESSGSSGSALNNLLDLQKIDQRVDRMKYHGVKDLVDDVQLMLKGAMQYYSFSFEVCPLVKLTLFWHNFLFLFFSSLKSFPDSFMIASSSAFMTVTSFHLMYSGKKNESNFF